MTKRVTPDKKNKKKVAVIGLGYVGLPMALLADQWCSMFLPVGHLLKGDFP
jgi:hypothetical protein